MLYTQKQKQKKLACREQLSLLATIPHSGTKIPFEAEWLKSLPPSILREDVDAWTDKLYGSVLEEFQIPYFVFEWHRYSLDVNRFAEDISENTVKEFFESNHKIEENNRENNGEKPEEKPRENPEEKHEKTHSESPLLPKHMIKDRDMLKARDIIKARDMIKARDIIKATDNQSHEGKTSQGEPLPNTQHKQGGEPYGSKQKTDKSPSDIHWHKSTKGHILMKEPISYSLHCQMIKKYFEPFHQKIQDQLNRFKQAGHKKVYLLDLHSMPSVGLSFHKDPGEQRAQIVLGDNNGQAAEKPFTDLVLSACRQAGFNTALNQPYSGGAISQRYGQPKIGQNALQLELNRSLYMDENTKQRSSHFKQTQDQFRKALSLIIQHLKK